MSFQLVASGKSETAKGEPKFFEFAASNLKASDYPHLPSTRIGKGDTAKDVPVVKISPASILVKEFSKIEDAREHVKTLGVTDEQFESGVLELINTAFRNDTVKVVRTRVSDAKILPANTDDLATDAANEVNPFAETEKSAGRVSLKATQEKAAQLAVQFAGDPAALAAHLMALLKVG